MWSLGHAGASSEPDPKFMRAGFYFADTPKWLYIDRNY